MDGCLCLGDVLSLLDDFEGVVWEAYHRCGPGRPPRNPLGILKVLIVRRLKGIPSDRELYRRLWNDPELKRLCDIEEYEKPYHPSQLTRFRQRIGPKKLEEIMNNILVKLKDAGIIKGKIIACDTTFIKAYSKRDPKDDSRGYSDPDARVGRAGKTYQLGYKLHLAVDAESELPLAVIAAPANQNEKKHALKLLEKTIKASKSKIKAFIADSQYSSIKFRKKIYSHKIIPVIPYPANQKPKEKEYLTVDKKFRAHGPRKLKNLYKHRASVERTISRLKQHLNLENHKLRGLKNIAIHILLCITTMLLIALATFKQNKPEKIRSPLTAWKINTKTSK
jgi:transposase